MLTAGELPSLAGWGLLCPKRWSTFTHQPLQCLLGSGKSLRKERWGIVFKKVGALVLTILWAHWTSGVPGFSGKEGKGMGVARKRSVAEGRRVGATHTKFSWFKFVHQRSGQVQEAFLVGILPFPKSPCQWVLCGMLGGDTWVVSYVDTWSVCDWLFKTPQTTRKNQIIAGTQKCNYY